MKLAKALTIVLEKYNHHILIITLVIGSGLRWFQLGKHSFWYDETFSVLTARLNLPQIVSNAALGVHPPGYYVFLHFWLQLGQSEFFIRSLSALFSVGAILLMYGLAGWLFDRATAALAALGMAVLPFQVYFGQEARMYSLVIFLAIALTWLFLYAVTTEQRWLAWSGYIVIVSLGLYVHYFVGFLWLGLHLWFGLNLPRYRPVTLRLLVADGLISLLFLPQLNQALTRTQAYLGHEAWQAPPHILSPLTTIYYLLFAHRAPMWLAPIGLFLTLALLLLILWESRRRTAAERHFELALWVSLLGPIILVACISWVSAHSIYVERSFAVACPALVLLLARGTLTAPRWSPTPYLTALLALPIGVTLTAHFLTPDPAKPPVREAALLIEKNFLPGDVTLHLQDASAIPALWYTPLPHQLIDVSGAAFIFTSTHRLFGGDVVTWPTAVTGADRLWLTVMPGFTGPAQIAVQAEIEASYPRLMMQDWGTVQLYLYDLREAKN